MSIIEVNNLYKTYKVHEKQEGLRHTITDFFNRKYIYKDAVKDLNIRSSPPPPSMAPAFFHGKKAAKETGPHWRTASLFHSSHPSFIIP